MTRETKTGPWVVRSGYEDREANVNLAEHGYEGLGYDMTPDQARGLARGLTEHADAEDQRLRKQDAMSSFEDDETKIGQLRAEARRDAEAKLADLKREADRIRNEHAGVTGGSRESTTIEREQVAALRASRDAFETQESEGMFSARAPEAPAEGN